MKLQTIQHKNSAVSFFEMGTGQALVLLHGFLENKSMWIDLATVWSEKYRVIAIDLLGHGETNCQGYVHTMEDQAAAIHAVLKHLKLRRIHLIGHSMGGYVALAFAEMFPDFIKSLVLQNSTALEDSAERKKNRLRAIKAVKHNSENFVRLAVSNLFAPDNHEVFAKEIENTRSEALKTPLQGIIAALEGMRERKNRTFILQSEQFPVLLILGAKDAVLDFETNKNIVKPENLVVFPDGHMSHIENKEALQKVVLQFLAKSIHT